eukprot:1886096-Rhodomonas_salina.3
MSALPASNLPLPSPYPPHLVQQLSGTWHHMPSYQGMPAAYHIAAYGNLIFLHTHYALSGTGMCTF